MNKLTTLQIIEKSKTLSENVEDLKTAIMSLRPGPSWEYGIKQDERKSVQMLYKEYTKACTELKEFNIITWNNPELEL